MYSLGSNPRRLEFVGVALARAPNVVRGVTHASFFRARAHTEISIFYIYIYIGGHQLNKNGAPFLSVSELVNTNVNVDVDEHSKNVDH